MEALDRRTASGGMDDTECDDNDESDSTISDFYEGFFFEFGCGGGGAGIQEKMSIPSTDIFF